MSVRFCICIVFIDNKHSSPSFYLVVRGYKTLRPWHGKCRKRRQTNGLYSVPHVFCTNCILDLVVSQSPAPPENQGCWTRINWKSGSVCLHVRSARTQNNWESSSWLCIANINGIVWATSLQIWLLTLLDRSAPVAVWFPRVFQRPLVGLYVSSVLGAPQGPPWGTWEVCNPVFRSLSLEQLCILNVCFTTYTHSTDVWYHCLLCLLRKIYSENSHEREKIGNLRFPWISPTTLNDTFLT